MNLKRPLRIGLPSLALGLAGAFLFAPLDAQGPAPATVGAKKCRDCHRTKSQGSQYPVWEASAHARSYAGLKTNQAREVAREAGVAGAPEAEMKCLKCHAPLAGPDSPESAAEGVGCEACHGPGSRYKKLTVMTSREKSVLNGLVVFKDAAAVKARCLDCHAAAHGRAFDFDAAWKLVRHTRPGKESSRSGLSLTDPRSGYCPSDPALSGDPNGRLKESGVLRRTALSEIGDAEASQDNISINRCRTTICD